MYLYSPQGYCRGHLVKRFSYPEETAQGGVDIDNSTQSFILATALTVLNSKWVMVSAVTQHVSAVTNRNVIALTVTALTFTHLFDSWKKGFLRSLPNHMSASTRPQRQLKRSRGNVLSVTKRVNIFVIALTVVEMTLNFWHTCVT